ncbi:MAG: GNAT family N-acetyltransferase [Boseongicola sp.]|nr:MAG: GNAT family N-acetyltransferase [Boseongicola sp.]
MGTISHYDPDRDQDDLIALMHGYRELTYERAPPFDHPVVDQKYGDEPFAKMLRDLAATHARPTGSILMVHNGEVAVGCGMTNPINQNTCEIQRVFLSADARGLGLGKSLIAALIDQATEDGYERIELNTISILHEAIVLYGKFGFRPCEPYFDFSAKVEAELLFLGLDIADRLQ